MRLNAQLTCLTFSEISLKTDPNFSLTENAVRWHAHEQRSRCLLSRVSKRAAASRLLRGENGGRSGRRSDQTAGEF